MPAITGIEVVYERWSRMLRATVTLPDGNTALRDIEDHGAAAAVLPYDPERRVAAVVRQFRAPAFHAEALEMLMEMPAGRLDEADPDGCARREALEEVGIRLGAVEKIGVVWSMPAISTERVHMYLAPYRAADRVAAGGGLAHETEFVESLEIPLAELAAMADRGEVTDAKLFLLLQTLRLRRPELFAG